MRIALAVFGLLLLGACAEPMQTAQTNAASQRSDLNRFVEPTGGAAYSESSMYFYEQGANPGAIGGPRVRVP
ncbi:MAG TPA: hypothetical protein VN632_07870 [Stellaceae bacterium]|nr:hypothetical protein [Stellaceae bacterium]